MAENTLSETAKDGLRAGGLDEGDLKRISQAEVKSKVGAKLDMKVGGKSNHK